MGPLRLAPGRFLSALAVTFLVPSFVHAAPASPDSASSDSVRYRLDPVVVVGERAPVSASKLPLEVDTIDRERLDAQRPVVLSDAMRQLAPVDVQRSGSLGKVTDIRLRGADPRHTLVLFDDIPLNGPWLGIFDFADLMDPGISRVEVLGGPASSLYGSAAVGGVIQIRSEAGSGAGTPGAPGAARGFAEYGDLQTFRGGLEWRGNAGSIPLGASATRLVSEGTGSRDAYHAWNGNLSGTVPFGSSDQLEASALVTEGEKELPYEFTFDPLDPTLSPFGSSKQLHDPNNDETDRLGAGRATWRHRLDPKLSLEGEVSGLYGKILNDNQPSGPTNDYENTDLKNSRGVGSVRALVSPDAETQMILGAEYRGEHVDRDDASSFGGFASVSHVDQSVHSRSLYAQGHAERGRLLADAGIRLDDHSRYGPYGLPRVAAGFLWRETGLKLRGGYGRAFTAPSLSDLYYPGYSNDTLRPERSTTWEAGADGRWLEGRLTAQGTYHTTHFRDLIQSNSFFAPDNIGEARIEGEDYAVQFAPARKITLRGTAAHLIAKKLTESDPDPDRRLPKRPSWRFGFGFEAQALTDLTFTGAWRWVDSVRDPFNFIDVSGNVLSGDNPGYANLDLGAIASLRRWTPASLNLRLLNVLDRNYSEVKGFPTPGRTATVGITFAP
jgi:vitamin B12 transporter